MKKNVMRFIFAWESEVFWKAQSQWRKKSCSAESKSTLGKFGVLSKICLFPWAIEVF